MAREKKETGAAVAEERQEERMEFRLHRQQKRLIETASAYSGRTVSAFAIDALLQEAQRVIREHEVAQLSDRDRDHFLDLLSAPAPPNAALRRASKRYGEVVSSSE
jgi:uncharacterized protein (DUF1778 family)